MKNKVLFYPVKDNPAKIQLICNKAHESILHEKRLLIFVPNIEAAQYVDNLLWKTPIDSFIPHTIAQTASKEWIVITYQNSDNLNQAEWLLNLCHSLHPAYHQFQEVYELLDETNGEKKDLSQKRIEAYKTLGTPVKIM